MEIGTNWEMLEEMPFQTVLAKARFDEVGNGETLRECGSLEYYDKANERISCKMEKPLKWFGQRAFHSVTTAHDPIIRELASEVRAQLSHRLLTLKFLDCAELSHALCSNGLVGSWQRFCHQRNPLALDDEHKIFLSMGLGRATRRRQTLLR